MQRSSLRPFWVALGIILVVYVTSYSRATRTASTANVTPYLQQSLNKDATRHSAIQKWKEEKNSRIVGLVFYGRREYVSILDCYLQRNLVKNGGLLDEVLFVIRTDKSADLVWIGELVDAVPEYTKTFQVKGRNGDFSDGWEVVESNNMYVKIDDDIVFIEDDTIGLIVKQKLDHPEYFLVSANLINQPKQAWVQYHLDVFRPYFPELTPPPGFSTRTNDYRSPFYHDQIVPSWYASELPEWSGPPDFTFNETAPAPFVGHRWLPARVRLDRTPVSSVSYESNGVSWQSWAVAAQTHYSFFENLEKGELDRYRFKLWDYHYERLSINLICIWGDDVMSVMPIDQDDEGYLTMNATRKLRRQAVMDGHGLAVHFGFGPQVIAHGYHGLGDTDLLDRYRAFAEERVCGKARGGMLI